MIELNRSKQHSAMLHCANSELTQVVSSKPDGAAEGIQQKEPRHLGGLSEDSTSSLLME